MFLNWPSVLKGGDKGMHLPLLEKKKATPATPWKTRVAVMVGAEWGKQQRFMVPLNQMSHPLFLGLFKEADEEYRFDHQKPGVISLPCCVDRFRQVLDIIDGETGCRGRCGSSHLHHHHHNSCNIYFNRV